MASLLNQNRPPVFCPGCSHDRVLHALDKAFESMELGGDRIAMVSDIGCSGLFDTFYNTHALHGLHGRALTYAAGLKLARPDLHVVVTMGDGGLGIGGAHLLSACRRNLDLTLLILNNFNFGMTGGQFSATTPPDATVGSGFLNLLEKPLDAGSVLTAAGAPFVGRTSAYRKDLAELIEEAIRFKGFSAIDIWGVCPGRYLKKNKLTMQMIDEKLEGLAPLNGPIPWNARPEYGAAYREYTSKQKPAAAPPAIEARFAPLKSERQEVVILGAAGQRIQTAGEILAGAGLSAGLQVTQKSEYNITVMTGPSITELILSSQPIDYTGITNPNVVIAIAPEGVERRKDLFARLDPEAVVLREAQVEIPATPAKVMTLDFKAQKLKKTEWAMASLAVLAKTNLILTPETLETAVEDRFKGESRESVKSMIRSVTLD